MFNTYEAQGIVADESGVYGMARLAGMTLWMDGKRITTYTQGNRSLTYDKRKELLTLVGFRSDMERIASVYEIAFAAPEMTTQGDQHLRGRSTTQKRNGGLWGKIWGLTGL